jgi:hypothetical protein
MLHHMYIECGFTGQVLASGSWAWLMERWQALTHALHTPEAVPKAAVLLLDIDAACGVSCWAAAAVEGIRY